MQIAVYAGYRGPPKRKGKKMAGKRKMNPKLVAASKACRLKGVKPFTKAFGACVKAEYRKRG